jgi:hypothetical protein
MMDNTRDPSAEALGAREEDLPRDLRLLADRNPVISPFQTWIFFSLLGVILSYQSNRAMKAHRLVLFLW